MNKATACFLSASLFPLCANAGFIGSINTETGLWQTGIDGSASGAAIGPSMAYLHDRYYGSLGFNLGSYSNKDAGANFDRNELEFSAGYRVLPLASAFVAYQHTFVSYTNSETEIDYKEGIGTLGAGVAVNYPLSSQLFILGSTSIGIPFASYSSDTQNVSGSGFRTAAELGASYRFNRQTSVNARLKGQNLVVNYDDSQASWNTSTWKLGLGLTHAF